LLAVGGYQGGFAIGRNLDPLDSVTRCLGRTNATPYFSFPNPNGASHASHELYSAKMRLLRQTPQLRANPRRAVKRDFPKHGLPSEL
jgi:hypothetical protein